MKNNNQSSLSPAAPDSFRLKGGKKAVKIFIIEVFLYSLSLGLGIVSSVEMNKISAIQKIEFPRVSLFDFISYFLISTAFFLALSYFLKHRKQKSLVLKSIFSLVVFWGGIILLDVWLKNTIISLAVMAVLVVWWWKKPSVLIQNICIILGIVGTGTVLGLSLAPKIVIILLILFSVYDVIAVYKTKHMVRMAYDMIESKAILGLVIPPDIHSFKNDLSEIQPGGSFMVLGGGDIVFPLLLCVSITAQGITDAFIVAFFSLIGLFAGFFILTRQKVRRHIPALPPIAFFAIVGFLLTLII